MSASLLLAQTESTGPVTLVVPEDATPLPVATPLVSAWIWPVLAVLVLAAGVLLVRRASKPIDDNARAARAFRLSAKAIGVPVNDQRTLAAMGEAAGIEPAALLLNERALRRARLAALAASKGEGPLASNRVKRACAGLGLA